MYTDFTKGLGSTNTVIKHTLFSHRKPIPLPRLLSISGQFSPN